MYFTIDSGFNLIFPLVSWENFNMFNIYIRIMHFMLTNLGAAIKGKVLSKSAHVRYKNILWCIKQYMQEC